MTQTESDAAPAEPDDESGATPEPAEDITESRNNESVITEDQGGDTVADPADVEPDEVENPAAAAKGRENSKLRERLRAMSEQLEVLQRGEAERLAAGRLGTGADLWAGGVELSELLDDDGNLAADRVTDAVNKVLDAHPHWRRISAPLASMVTANGKIHGGPTQPTFEQAFAPRRQ